MKNKLFIIILILCSFVGVLFILCSNDAMAQRICTREECDGCISSPACENASVGDKCTLMGKTGKCIQLKTCPRLQACCGCELGHGEVYLDENERRSTDEQRPAWVRFVIATEGMGVVKCGTCSTAGGCESVWIDAGTSIACTATPAPNYKFLHWTANGNFAGDKPVIHFGKKGATLKGHFGQ